MYAWHTYGALFAVRCIVKYLIELLGEEEMLRHLEAGGTNTEKPNVRLEAFLEALIEIIVDVPLRYYVVLHC